MANSFSRSNQIQSTEWSLHPQVPKRISQKWSCRSIHHSSEPQGLTVFISSSRPTCMGDRCSEYKLVRSCCLCLPSYSSSSQDDPDNTTMKLPHHTNSLRLARDALVLGPSTEIPLQLPVSTTLLKQSHN